MTTTGAAEKAEKRRALGRGLDSLLPGPRVVGPAGRVEAAVEGSGGSGEQQVPHRASSPVRNDMPQKHVIPERKMHGHMVPERMVPEPMIPENDAIYEEGEASEAYGGASVEPSVAGEGITIQAVAEEAAPRGTYVRALPIASIQENPYQTRYLFDKEALKELADSIKVNGVLQPVIVRPGEEEGRYILVLGERRLKASKLAGKETIPAVIRRVSLQQAAEMTLVENLQREDLNCMEQAEAFRVLSKEFNMTQEEIGKRVGMARESVSNYMRLLRLPEKVMEYLLHDELTFSEARELLGLEDEKKMQEVADIVVGKHMTLVDIETLVAKYNGWPDAQDPPRKPGVGGARWQDPNVRAAQGELERLLRVRVRIKDKKGKGRIVIEYANVDDYERVVGMLKGK